MKEKEREARQLKNWTLGILTVTLFIVALISYTLVTRKLTCFQATLVFLTYYGMLTMAFCLFLRHYEPLRNDFYRPFVSIIVPAKNEEQVIEATVRSLAGLNYRKGNRPHFEIIVVDDSSRDGTSLILERLRNEFPMLMPLRRDGGAPGKSAVLNFGLSHSKGEVIAIFDADSRVEPDFLKKTVPYLFEPHVAGVQGRVRITNASENILTLLQEDEFATYAHMFQISKDIFGGVMILAGNGQVTKRSALEDAGGWNEKSATDDMDLTMKFLLEGKMVRYCRDAVVWQEGISHPRPFLRQRIRWAEGMLKCLYDYMFPVFASKKISFIKKCDSLIGLFRIVAPLLVWMCYLETALVYLCGWIFTTTLPDPLINSLPWVFAIVMGGGMLKFVDRPNLSMLIRVPIYWGYNFFWMLAVPVGFLNCIKNMHTVQWDKTEHRGAAVASAVSAPPSAAAGE
ncbi:MAG: glycosyltransferase [Candidatus Eremiobacteraeota bacterium]|nr:glycosyltransferase [Candidatus Eremiobacteraeota bacterium]